MVLSALATITDVPDASRLELGTAVIVGGAFLGIGLVICTLIFMFRRNPPLEGQFVDYEDHQRHVDFCAEEHKALWIELRKNQNTVASMSGILEHQNAQLNRMETKLDRAIERAIPARRLTDSGRLS